jgi:hypothetical protein
VSEDEDVKKIANFKAALVFFFPKTNKAAHRVMALPPLWQVSSQGPN